MSASAPANLNCSTTRSLATTILSFESAARSCFEYRRNTSIDESPSWSIPRNRTMTTDPRVPRSTVGSCASNTGALAKNRLP